MTAYRLGLVFCWLPAFKMFSRPFSATWTILESCTVSKSHIGGIHPIETCQKRIVLRLKRGSKVQSYSLHTRYLICSAVPPLVAFVTAQAASLRVLNSAFCRISINTGKIPASITACICSLLPAAIFEMVQHASFRIVSFDEDSKWRMHGNALQFRISWVCASSPVTILPTARRAADTTFWWLCLKDNGWIECLINQVNN